MTLICIKNKTTSKQGYILTAAYDIMKYFNFDSSNDICSVLDDGAVRYNVLLCIHPMMALIYIIGHVDGKR